MARPKKIDPVRDFNVLQANVVASRKNLERAQERDRVARAAVITAAKQVQQSAATIVNSVYYESTTAAVLEKLSLFPAPATAPASPAK